MGDLKREVALTQDFCSRIYGQGLCTASIPATGSAKCYNTAATCQDPTNYAPQPLVLTFVMPDSLHDGSRKIIPSLSSIEITPPKLGGGTGKDSPLGERGSVRVSFIDHAWDDAYVDKYRDQRITGAAGDVFDPIEMSTFWRKWRARNKFYTGRPLSVSVGVDSLVSRHYLIDKIDGLASNPSITAKDPLKMADGDRAMCPVVSSGVLAANIGIGLTPFNLSPSGAGAAYPASGDAVIGKEYLTYTRTNDTITPTVRGVNGVVSEHDSGDTFQAVKKYTGQTVADIIYDLLVNFAGVDPAYITVADWQAEMVFITNVYTAAIAKPTAVKQLIGELAEQSGVGIAWDDINSKIIMRAVRPPSFYAETITDDSIIADSMSIKDRPDRRISRVWTSYGVIDPVRGLNEPSNYRTTIITADPLAEDAPQFGEPKILQIFSRWIPQFGSTAARNINNRIISRFRDITRDISFEVPYYFPVGIGETRSLMTRKITDDRGFPALINIRILSAYPVNDVIKVDAEEQLFSASLSGDGQRVIVIDAAVNNINLKVIHDSLYPSLGPADSVVFVVNPGVVVGSDSTSIYSIVSGSWQPQNVVKLINNGTIVGMGGAGGRANSSPPLPYLSNGSSGIAGGGALYIATALAVENNGVIGGGGGGGGAGGTAHGFEINSNTIMDGGGAGGGAGAVAGVRGMAYDGSYDLPGVLTGYDGSISSGGQGSAGRSNRTDRSAPKGGRGGDLGQYGVAGDNAFYVERTYDGNGNAIDTIHTAYGGIAGAPGVAINGDSLVTFSGTGGVILGPRIN